MGEQLTLPRYPIYIPSKGRADKCETALMFRDDKVPFSLVVEPQEREEYAKEFGDECILELPFSNKGSVIPARNWIKEHATAAGHSRHWQFDDNIRNMYRLYKQKRVYCQSGIALAILEDFVDRYENVAIAGFNYTMFGILCRTPFYLNVHVYSCSLILNSTPNVFRGKYNEDTDYCLQVLADGWCTVLFNAFLAHKQGTMVMKGGNTDELYHGDGRLKMAKSLKRQWPYVAKVGRRFKRPQHMIRSNWMKFDTPLKRREDVDFSNTETNEYGMRLTQKAPEIRSKRMKDIFEGYQQ